MTNWYLEFKVWINTRRGKKKIVTTVIKINKIRTELEPHELVCFFCLYHRMSSHFLKLRELFVVTTNNKYQFNIFPLSSKYFPFNLQSNWIWLGFFHAPWVCGEVLINFRQQQQLLWQLQLQPSQSHQEAKREKESNSY
jgi:hypothetical protein